VDTAARYQAGLEIEGWRLVSLRAGLRGGGSAPLALTGGGGVGTNVRRWALALDYAYAHLDDVGVVQKMAVTLGF
jgi:hypothetical protein